MDVTEQAIAILASRGKPQKDDDMRTPNVPSKHDKNAKPLRVLIDAKRADLRDKAEQSEVVG